MALKANSEVAVSHAAKGLYLARTGKLAEGLAGIEVAARLDPGNADIQGYLGGVLSELGQEDAAERYLKQGIELDPGNWMQYRRYTTFLQRNGRHREAIPYLSKAVEIAPDNYEAYRNLALSLIRLGQADEAVRALKRSLEIRPTASAYVYLGDAYRLVPRDRPKSIEFYNLAATAIREALSRRSNDSGLRATLSKVLASSGRIAEAGTLLVELESDPSISAGALFQMALAYEISGERNAACSALKKALDGGFRLAEIQNEPEFADLRRDSKYLALVSNRNSR